MSLSRGSIIRLELQIVYLVTYRYYLKNWNQIRLHGEYGAKNKKKDSVQNFKDAVILKD